MVATLTVMVATTGKLRIHGEPMDTVRSFELQAYPVAGLLHLLIISLEVAIIDGDIISLEVAIIEGEAKGSLAHSLVGLLKVNSPKRKGCCNCKLHLLIISLEVAIIEGEAKGSLAHSLAGLLKVN
ncbi:hypothetical protein Droror1_Dr00015035 [Drosera rotundifolia]